MKQDKKQSFHLHRRNEIYYFQLTKPDGKRTSALSTGEKSETRAIARVIDYINEQAAKKKIDPIADFFFKDWASAFFTPQCPHIQRLRDEDRPYAERTRLNSRANLVNHILSDDILCSKKIKHITRGDILDFRTRLIEKLGKRRVTQSVYSTLRVIFSELEFRQIIDRSPCHGVGQITYQEKSRTAFTLDQISEILQPEFYSNRLCYEMTLCAATTGMRAGEVRALKWQNIDKLKRTIKIVLSMSPDSSEIGPPKWHKFRTTAYPDILSAVLESRRGLPDEFVFLGPNGVITYKEWRTAFTKATKALGIPNATLHGLRHSLATHLREAGVGDEHIRAAFGWSNVGIQENYTHRELYSVQSHLDAVKKLIGG